MPGVPDCPPTLVEPLLPPARPLSPFGPLEPPMEFWRGFTAAFGGLVGVELLERVDVTVEVTGGAGDVM